MVDVDGRSQDEDRVLGGVGVAGMYGKTRRKLFVLGKRRGWNAGTRRGSSGDRAFAEDLGYGLGGFGDKGGCPLCVTGARTGAARKSEAEGARARMRKKRFGG